MEYYIKTLLWKYGNQGLELVVKCCAGAHLNSEVGETQHEVKGLVLVAAARFPSAAPFCAAGETLVPPILRRRRKQCFGLFRRRRKTIRQFLRVLR